MVLVALYAGASYNELLRKNEAINAEWAQVEVQYQKRLDLIPSLVDSVKGITAYADPSVFGALEDARSNYAGAVTSDAKAVAASSVESALGKLIAVIESYPELKSSNAVTSLMAELEGTKNGVSIEGKAYDDDVLAYNASIRTSPTSVMASVFGFGDRTYFQVTDIAASSSPASASDSAL